MICGYLAMSIEFANYQMYNSIYFFLSGANQSNELHITSVKVRSNPNLYSVIFLLLFFFLHLQTSSFVLSLVFKNNFLAFG